MSSLLHGTELRRGIILCLLTYIAPTVFTALLYEGGLILICQPTYDHCCTRNFFTERVQAYFINQVCALYESTVHGQLVV